MYSPEQVIELVEASYERGFNDGVRSAYDTVAFVDSFAEAQEEADNVAYTTDSYDAADAAYLEFIGQKVDDLLERVISIERWVYGTPRETACECKCDDREHWV